MKFENYKIQNRQSLVIKEKTHNRRYSVKFCLEANIWKGFRDDSNGRSACKCSSKQDTFLARILFREFARIPRTSCERAGIRIREFAVQTAKILRR